MKRLITIALLALSGLVANAQVFSTLSFLNVQSLNVTNTAGYTNTLPYFGWSTLTSTNTPLLQYTNRNGTYVLIPLTNAVSGFVSASNGVGFNTNDQVALAADIPFHADRNGNVCTNYVLDCAALYNSTSTGALVCVFAPIVGGNDPGPNPAPLPFVNNVVPTLLDLANTATVAFPVLRGGATNSCVSVDWSKYAAYKGMRLVSAGMTNSLGQAWVFKLQASTFIP